MQVTGERKKLPDTDLFGGEYRLPPETRLLQRFSVRLSPGQKQRLAEHAKGKGCTPSEVVRLYIIECVGE